MTKKVSIIVPVYNVEQYLERCIKSITNQTYKNIEIILVNDGSTDSSLQICKTYESDSRFIIVDKQNGGLSDARNAGLKVASGDYVAFIDSDDFIRDEMIKTMLESAEKKNADICACDMVYLYDSGHLVYASGGDFTSGSVNNNPSLIRINNSACNKLFKKEMFDDIQFPVGVYYEDLATIPILLYKAKCVTKVNEAYYVYYQRSGSIAHTANKKIFEIYDAIDGCINYVKKHGNEKAVLNELEHFYVIHGLDLTTIRIKDFDDKTLREEYLIQNMNELNKRYPEWKKDIFYKTAGLKKKFIYTMLSRGKVKTVLKIYDK
ncbi:MAG: glycosyltransferase [Erysipelotrichaceae bacterium]